MRVRLVVISEQEDDADESTAWLASLWEEVSELEDIDVRRSASEVPASAKGLGVLASLVVKTPLDGAKMLMSFLREWVIRTGRTVEASIDGDMIKITGASREQQDQVIGAWLGRHASST